MSNPSLWRALIGLGLKQDPINPRFVERTEVNEMCTIVEDGYIINRPHNQLHKDLIDCGKNIRLFLALAALRDDSDISQWFIYDDRYWNDENPERFWFVCMTDDVADDMFNHEMWKDCIKATSKELICHFKEDEQ